MMRGWVQTWTAACIHASCFYVVLCCCAFNFEVSLILWPYKKLVIHSF